jgi:hypothetical protein
MNLPILGRQFSVVVAAQLTTQIGAAEPRPAGKLVCQFAAQMRANRHRNYTRYSCSHNPPGPQLGALLDPGIQEGDHDQEIREQQNLTGGHQHGALASGLVNQRFFLTH